MRDPLKECALPPASFIDYGPERNKDVHFNILSLSFRDFAPFIIAIH